MYIHSNKTVTQYTRLITLNPRGITACQNHIRITTFPLDRTCHKRGHWVFLKAPERMEIEVCLVHLLENFDDDLCAWVLNIMSVPSTDKLWIVIATLLSQTLELEKTLGSRIFLLTIQFVHLPKNIHTSNHFKIESFHYSYLVT